MKQKNDKSKPIDRINYSGDLEPVIEKMAAIYEIGTMQDISIVNIGYSDFNVIVKTNQGRFLAKIFWKKRTPKEILRYTDIMLKVIEKGINHPPILKYQKENVVYTDKQANGISLVLLRFIEGKTFFELRRAPNIHELRLVLGQAAKINNMNFHPPYIFDSWAIPNIHVMFNNTKQFIKPKYLPLIKAAIERYDTIPVETLPNCFVHGDLTNTNVLKSEDKKIYILDFSVANWNPRIQELAVIATNLMHNSAHENSLKDISAFVSKEYSKINNLIPEEHKWLYDYALAGLTMEIIGVLHEKYVYKNYTKETDYLLRLGIEGLKKELLS